MAGPHVFGPGRLGCWIVSISNLTSGRMSKLKALGISDLFLKGPAASVTAKGIVLNAGFNGCHAYWSVDNLGALDYADRTLADIARWGPGAGDLNIELGSDPPLPDYIKTVVQVIRSQRPNYNLRINLAPRKAFGLQKLSFNDPHLYACQQNYFGNMDQRHSEDEALRDLLAFGVPLAKASICYGAACKVGGVTGAKRVNILPDVGIRVLDRGVIFTDDLLAEAGLL